MITEYRTELLANRHIESVVFGKNLYVGLSELESDGRKQKTVKRELVESGYIVVDADNPDKLSATSKAFDEMEGEKPNLIEEWNKSRSRWNRRIPPAKSLPCVSFIDLKLPQRCYLINNASDYEFYIAPEDQVRDTTVDVNLSGPYPLAELPNQYKEIVLARLRDKSRSFGVTQPYVMVTNCELKETVGETLLKERIEVLLKRNLAWGLVNFGILEKGENQHIRHDNEEPADLVYSEGSGSLFGMSLGNLGEDFTQWGPKLDENIRQCCERINSLQHLLTLLRKVSAGVKEMGGMETFVEKLRGEMLSYIQRKDAEKINESADAETV